MVTVLLSSVMKAGECLVWLSSRRSHSPGAVTKALKCWWLIYEIAHGESLQGLLSIAAQPILTLAWAVLTVVS